MKKYLSIFKISFQQEFAYRLNFVMWRVRNVLQVFLAFFLWDSVFSDPNRNLFGYDRAKILTYVFGMLVIKSIVTSSRTIDVPGQIARGELMNHLLKPISYFKYWFVRDVSSKTLNLSFAVIETLLLFLILRPDVFFQTDVVYVFFFIVSLVLAVILYFLLLFLASMLPFWHPEQAWGVIFLLFIIVEFLGGGVFPIDILPDAIQKALYLTPFPYLLFVPLQTYLGKMDTLFLVRNTIVALMWVGLLSVLVRNVWNRGLRIYNADGR